MGNTLLDFHNGNHTDQEKDLIGIENMSCYLNNNYNISVSSNSIKENLIDRWYSDFFKRKSLIELDINEYVSEFLILIGKDSIEIDSFELMTEFYRAYIDEVIVNNGAIQTLKKLHGNINIGVISNCILFDEIYEQIFLKVGLGRYINKYIFSYSRKIRKPDKRLFNEMLEYFNVLPHESIMVGDNINADLLPAKELGMQTILYSKKHFKNEFIDYSISNFEEIPAIIGILQ